MAFFDKLLGKDARIQVTFIDNATGQSIGVSQMLPEQLPATFEAATTFTIRETEWAVQDAVPATAAEFTRTGQLTLRLDKIEYVDPQNINYTQPTLSAELPDLTEQALFPDFDLTIFGDDWRQNEFLPAAAQARIAPETAAIRRIWEHHSFAAEAGFQAFRQLHVRDTIGEPGLALDFARLQTVLGAPRRGSLRLHDEPGYVRNGFALQTAATTYYGLLAEGVVTHLCLDGVNEDALPEVLAVNQAFDTVFVVWYHAQVVGPDGELPVPPAAP